MQSTTTLDTTATALNEPVARVHERPTNLLNGESLYSPAALAKVLNVPGQGPGTRLNGSTIFRYTRKPKVVNGVEIRLEAVRIGDRWLTSVGAFTRYTAQLTSASLQTNTTPTPPSPTPKQRTSAAAKASKKADAIFGAAGE